MDDPEIQQRVNELDAAVTKDGSKLLIYVDPDHGNCAFVANRKGYLRAGIEMLRAAIVPLAAHESTTPIDIKYLCGERGLRVDKLERREDINTARLPSGWKSVLFGTCFGLGCLALFIFLVICAIAGLGNVIGWLFRK